MRAESENLSKKGAKRSIETIRYRNDTPNDNASHLILRNGSCAVLKRPPEIGAEVSRIAPAVSQENDLPNRLAASARAPVALEVQLALSNGFSSDRLEQHPAMGDNHES